MASRAFRVGAVLELSEADYMYGTGVLTLRLTRIGSDPAQYPKMEWVIVEGVRVYPSGATDPQPREVTVRVSAIAGALRPVNWMPAEGDARRTTPARRSEADGPEPPPSPR